MSASIAPILSPSPEADRAAVRKSLRQLYLTLFLRGRTSRGLQVEKAPSSIGQKLALTLFINVLIGFLALGFFQLPLFALSVYLHGITFAFVAMFLSASAGEILFNKEEGDILLHRPIEPGVLLWAKIRVLFEVSLWIAGAVNLIGFFVGCFVAERGVLFLPAHAVSLTMEALFSAGCVVLTYQLCLRWFGREKLDGIITTAQVMLSVGAVLGSQILPRIIMHDDAIRTFGPETWWIAFLPPSWFAGFDDAIAGNVSAGSWLLAFLAVAGTGLVAWLAFSKLAADYDEGLQRITETSTKVQKKSGRRWIDILIGLPPLRWWLHDPVERASFLLSAAYLLRDRDVKLRVYPGVAPMMAFPAVILFQEFGRPGNSFGSSFGVIFASGYLVLIPLMGVAALQHSQQWLAADIFRAAPVAGPARLSYGACRAVMFLLSLPAVLIFAIIILVARRDVSQLALLLPGMILLPLYGLIPCLGGQGVPLSKPIEESKKAGQGMLMFMATMFSLVLSGLAMLARNAGFFGWFVALEAAIAALVYWLMRRSIGRHEWSSLE